MSPQGQNHHGLITRNGILCFVVVHRYPITYDYADDVLMQPWFIILLGTVIAVIVFLIIATMLVRRIQAMKQTSLSSIHGTQRSNNHHINSLAQSCGGKPEHNITHTHNRKSCNRNGA